MEIEWDEIFGKRLRAIGWVGQDMCVLRFEGDIKVLFYVKDNRLNVEPIKGDDLTEHE